MRCLRVQTRCLLFQGAAGSKSSAGRPDRGGVTQRLGKDAETAKRHAEENVRHQGAEVSQTLRL